MKHLCELSKKGVGKNLPKILETVTNPVFICQKCGRVADRKARLCKPAKISDLKK
jgi:hypothetical protein